jgi:hypothetical protein
VAENLAPVQILPSRGSSPAPSSAAAVPLESAAGGKAGVTPWTRYAPLARPRRPNPWLARIKGRVRARSPRWLYDFGSRTYRTVLGLPALLALLFRHGLPRRIVYFGTAPGDDLLCTPALSGLGSGDGRMFLFLSNHLELFDGLEGAFRPAPFHPQYLALLRWCGASVHRLEYAPYDAATDRSAPPRRHIIAELCRHAGLRGRVALKPVLSLRPQELANARWAENHLVIQSSGLGGSWPMQNKQWYPERFQAVVDALRDEWRFIQLGVQSDPELVERSICAGVRPCASRRPFWQTPGSTSATWASSCTWRAPWNARL